MDPTMVGYLKALSYYGRNAAILAAQCRLEAGATSEIKDSTHRSVASLPGSGLLYSILFAVRFGQISLTRLGNEPRRAPGALLL